MLGLKYLCLEKSLLLFFFFFVDNEGEKCGV